MEQVKQQEPKESIVNNGRDNISQEMEEILQEMQLSQIEGQGKAENSGMGTCKNKGGDILISSPHSQF